MRAATTTRRSGLVQPDSAAVETNLYGYAENDRNALASFLRVRQGLR